MKRIIFVLILYSCIYEMEGQSVVVTPTYSPFSYGELATPLIMATEMHRKAQSQIHDLQMYIIDILSKNIDNKLRAELNQEYSDLKYLSDYIEKNGIHKDAFNIINNIYNNINEHITSYNNRVAQRNREYELNQKSNVESQWKQPTESNSNGIKIYYPETSTIIPNLLVTCVRITDSYTSIEIKSAFSNYEYCSIKEDTYISIKGMETKKLT